MLPSVNFPDDAIEEGVGCISPCTGQAAGPSVAELNKYGAEQFLLTLLKLCEAGEV